MTLRTAVMTAILMGPCLVVAHADPPPGTDINSPLHKWFAELREPHFSSGCCGYHQDCWETDAYQENGVWYAKYHPDRAASDLGWWIRVPASTAYQVDDSRLPQGFNMAIRAVLCAAPNRPKGGEMVFCFVPPASAY
jgi:hypothetical protein